MQTGAAVAMRSRLVIAVAFLAGTSLVAQQPTASFKTGIDVLTIEASVVDGDARPVPDLSAGDFDVKVGGEPRRVVSARYIEANQAVPIYGAEGAVPAHVSNQGAPPGRIVLFAVDRDAIASGSERTVLNAAASMLDALGPADAAGAVALPQGTTELTRDKDRVKAALLRMTGTRPATSLQEHYLTWDEAVAFERGDARVFAEAIERECPRTTLPPGMVDHCVNDLKQLSLEMRTVGRGKFQQSIAALRGLLGQLAALRGTKHLVLLSGGLPFGQELLPWYNDFARDAAAADVVVHAIHLEAFEADVANRKIVSSAFGSREFATGLGTLASMTGGAFYTAAGSGAGIFARITSALTGFYQIGIETTLADRTGATKPIEVRVSRQGLSLRYGRRTLTPASAATTPTDRLAVLMQQPTDIAELPIGIATYTTRGDDPSTLRVLISAEIGQLQSGVEWGFTAFSEGNAVATGRQRLDPAGGTPMAGTLSGKLLPGRYRLRIAAVDGDGRAAVTDLPLSVGLRAAGALQFSDVILGVADADAKLQARSSFVQGESLSGLAEVLSADPAVLDRTRTVFEIAQAGAAEPLKRFLMAARSGSSANLLSNQIAVSTATLPPGIYVASVIPHLDDQPVGRVSRRFEITARR